MIHRKGMAKRLAAGLTAALVAGLSAFAAEAQIPEDVLVVGQVAEPKSLDPATVTAVNDFRILVNVYDGLTRYADGTLRVVPGLAESWEISEDGTVYTFKLREGVTFHDGTPFNAEAVKFNFDRMLNEDHPYHDTGPFPLAFFFSAIERTEVIDEYEVALHLSEPYAPLLSNRSMEREDPLLEAPCVAPTAVGRIERTRHGSIPRADQKLSVSFTS